MSERGASSRLARVTGWSDLGPGGRVIQTGMAVAALALLCMATVDKPLARYLHAQVTGDVRAIWQAITHLGDATGYVIAALLVFLGARLGRRVLAPGRLRDQAAAAGRYSLLMLVGLAVSGAILNISKVAFGRLRPNYLYESDIAGFIPFHLDFGANTFPSGHSQAIWAIVTVLCLAWPRYRIALCTLAASVAASRVVLSTHFLSDVLVGSYLGIATVLLLAPVILERRSRAVGRGAVGTGPVGTGAAEGGAVARVLPALPRAARRCGARQCLVAATAVLAVVWVLFPEIDLWLMRAVYLGDNDFWLRGTPISDLYDAGMDWLFWGIGLFVLGASLAAALGRPVPGFGRDRLLVIWITLVGVVGVIDNLLFKNSFGRPRPKDVTAFGGDMPFHPPWLPGGACPSNCSFPSGDVGFAFILVAFALAVPQGAGRRLALAGAVGFGVFVAAMRVLTGDHFPSDALFGALLTVLSVLLLDAWLARRRRDGAPDRPASGAAA